MTVCAKCGHDPESAFTVVADFVVPRHVPSANARHSNAGPARFAYAKLRDAWAADLKWMRFAYSEHIGDDEGRVFHRIINLEARMPVKAKRYVRLVRRFTGRQREWDYDNLVGGMKPIVDALKISGWIVDDKRAWLEATYEQAKVGPTEIGLRVVVREAA